MRLAVLAPALALILGHSSHPQAAAREYARVVVLRPRLGLEAEFEAGYKRHVEWHRQNGDSWTWYGWTVVLGERTGSFMDGTFGHSAAALDSAVLPAADAADNAANVLPYAEIMTHALYQHVAAMSRGGPAPPSSPFLELTSVDVRPGHEAAFEATVRRLRARTGDSVFVWYRLIAGGRLPSYLLVRPRTTLGGVAHSTPFLNGLGLAPRDQEVMATAVGKIQVDVLRYRADMSYVPAQR